MEELLLPVFLFSLLSLLISLLLLQSTSNLFQKLLVLVKKDFGAFTIKEIFRFQNSLVEPVFQCNFNLICPHLFFPLVWNRHFDLLLENQFYHSHIDDTLQANRMAYELAKTLFMVLLPSFLFFFFFNLWKIILP